MRVRVRVPILAASCKAGREAIVRVRGTDTHLRPSRHPTGVRRSPLADRGTTLKALVQEQARGGVMTAIDDNSDVECGPHAAGRASLTLPGKLLPGKSY